MEAGVLAPRGVRPLREHAHWATVLLPRGGVSKSPGCFNRARVCMRASGALYWTNTCCLRLLASTWTSP